MNDIKKILYPSDFSKHSLASLPMALDLASKYDAELHLLHVIDDSYQYWMGGSESAVPVAISENEISESALHEMDNFVAKNLSGNDGQLVKKMVHGRPFLEIINYARNQQIDLIAISTHGHGALASMLLGSVTEKVVRKAPCAVLTIRHEEHKFEMP